MDDWKSATRHMRNDLNMDWRDITIACMHYFPNETYKQVYEHVRHIDKSHHKKVQPTLMSFAKREPLGNTEQFKAQRAEMVTAALGAEPSIRDVGYTAPPALSLKTYGTNTLVFSDTHMPFNHPNYLQFLIDTYEKYECGSVVCLGDLVDHHALSRHESETCAKSPYDELDMAITEVQKYVAAFPAVKVVIGNHDTVISRQSKFLGIGERFLKSFSELYKLPNSWEIADEHIIDGVLYKHGINCLGKNGAINTAITERMSTCIGHSHSNGGCDYSANKRSIIFGLNTGCGIDISAYAFAYGEHSKNRPTIGCGVVYNSGHAEFLPMPDRFFRST